MFLSYLFSVLIAISLLLTAVDFCIGIATRTSGRDPVVDTAITIGLVLFAVVLLTHDAHLVIYPFPAMVAAGGILCLMGFVSAIKQARLRAASNWNGGWVLALLASTSFSLAGIAYITYALAFHV